MSDLPRLEEEYRPNPNPSYRRGEPESGVPDLSLEPIVFRAQEMVIAASFPTVPENLQSALISLPQ